MKKFLAVFLSLSLILGILLTGMVVNAEEGSSIPHSGEYPLSDNDEGHFTAEGVAAGYWVHPFTIGSKLSVTFKSPIWIIGFQYFAFSSDFDQFLDVELVNAVGEVLWTGRTVAKGDNYQEVGFDKSYPPGEYTISFTNVENPEYPGGENQHFVLGSGHVRVDLRKSDIKVSGYHHSNSLGAPEITLYEGEPDPEYTGGPIATEAPGKGSYPLSDQSEGNETPYGVAAGYWMHPFIIGEKIEVVFDSPIWMDGFSFFAWCNYCDTFLDITLADEKDNVIWSGRVVCYGNELWEVDFDKSFPPGLYTLSFINAENPDFPDGENQHFVLGSGLVREDLDPEDIEVFGFTASNSLGAPQIELFEGEVNPEFVTPEPTPSPEVTPSPVPTATPETTPTAEPTEEPTATPEPAGNSCGGFVGGFAAVCGVAALAVLVIRKKKD